VNYAGKNFDIIKKALLKAGFTDVTPDANPNVENAWFLLPQYQKVPDGTYTNNYYNE
jgi:hypothetical protein